jgi:hypothetical protein
MDDSVWASTGIEIIDPRPNAHVAETKLLRVITIFSWMRNNLARKRLGRAVGPVQREAF